MIFVTTGTQAPFDRLIRVADEIAGLLYPLPIIVQAFGSKQKVKRSNLKLLEFVPQDEFELLFFKAELVISHAGTGSIFSALTRNKPIIVMPRKASLGEHRNEHQLATAKKFNDLGLLEVAFCEEELKIKVVDFIQKKRELVQKHLGDFAPKSFIEVLHKDFLNL